MTPYYASLNNSVAVSNGTLNCTVASLVGRSYKLQTTTDFSTWTTALSFTNSNTNTTFYLTNNFAIPAPQACSYGVRVTDPYGIVSQVVTQSSTFTGITLFGAATNNLILGSPFIDPGAIAVENCSNSLAVTTNGSVDVNVMGTYIITYQATTSGGGNLVASRTVNVVGAFATATTLSSSVNPAIEGEAITFTATVSSGAAARTGTVTFTGTGTITLGTANLSGNTATLTLSGGAGTNSITATYNGDTNNIGSTSDALSQVIQTSGPVVMVNPAQMSEGFDYAAVSSMPEGNPVAKLGVWQLTSDLSGNTASTVNVNIRAGDLSGATNPDIKPLPNVTTNPAAHLWVNKGASDREFLRGIGPVITSGPAYFSFLLNTTVNPASNGAPMATLLAANANNAPLGNDPLTLYGRNADGTHYNLGIRRLGGAISWATKSLAVSNTCLVVLKYRFGGSDSLYINPTPGWPEPATPAANATGGTNAEPADIGTILFYESGSTNPLSDGQFSYDLLRVDASWYNVTPSATGSFIISAGAAKLAFLSEPQTFAQGSNSALITVALQDQSNHVFSAAADTVVSLNTTSGNSDEAVARFLSGDDGTTPITSVTIAAGTSAATFYYNDGTAGTPTITATSGLLTPATQSETITPGASAGDVTCLQVSGQSLNISISNLLTHTTFPPGDTVSLSGISSPSSSGLALSFDANYIHVPVETNNDSFTYTVGGSPSGATASAQVFLTVVNSVGHSDSIQVASGTAGITFVAVSNLSYQIQRATNLTFTGGTRLWSTNVPASGVFQLVDDFSDLGGQPQGAYYRLLYTP